MPKYVIEREIPGAGNIGPQDLQAISQKSCSVLQGLGPQIQWVQSYVTEDKIYCVYIAPNKEMVLSTPAWGLSGQQRRRSKKNDRSDNC